MSDIDRRAAVSDIIFSMTGQYAEFFSESDIELLMQRHEDLVNLVSRDDEIQDELLLMALESLERVEHTPPRLQDWWDIYPLLQVTKRIRETIEILPSIGFFSNTWGNDSEDMVIKGGWLHAFTCIGLEKEVVKRLHPEMSERDVESIALKIKPLGLDVIEAAYRYNEPALRAVAQNIKEWLS